jgi:hypothetical protein
MKILVKYKILIWIQNPDQNKEKQNKTATTNKAKQKNKRKIKYSAFQPSGMEHI